jgi:hypothetical protein
MKKLIVVSSISLMAGVVFLVAITATAIMMNFRQPFIAEKIALEIACPVMAQRGDGTPDRKVDCAFYAATGLVRKDFK